MAYPTSLRRLKLRKLRRTSRRDGVWRSGRQSHPVLHDFETVAATSLSDIVCGFHVAGCCIETTSIPLVV